MEMRPGDTPCASLSGARLFEVLQGEARREVRHRGDILVVEGAPPEFVGLVLRGSVKILKHAQTGREVIVEVLGPGKVFGMVPVLDRQPYPASVAVVEDGEFGRVAAERFREIVVSDARLALDLLAAFGGRVRRMTSTLLDSATSDVEARLAGRLLGLVAPGQAVVRVTRQELADLAGTTVETAIRVTKRWEREGLVRLSRGRVEVCDRPALASLAGG